MSYKDTALNKLKNTPVPTWKRAVLKEDVFPTSIDTVDVEILSKPSCVVIEDYNSADEIQNYDKEIIHGLGEYFVNYAEANYKNGISLTSSGSDIESEPVHIKHSYKSDTNVVESNFIKILPSDSMTLILDYQSESGKTIHHGITRLHVSNGARLNVIRFQNTNSDSYFFDSMYFHVDEGAEVKFFDCQIGSKFKSVAVQADLKSRHSSFEVYNAYLGFEGDNLDLSYIARHYGSPSNSKILAKGALDGNANKTFRGTLDFQRGSSQSVGEEDEFVLILDPRAHSDSLPALMCQEDDVIGEHAASIGRIDTNMLFYMMSRGIPYKDAYLSLIKASIYEIFNDIPDENIKEEIAKAFDSRLIQNLNKEDTGA